MPNVNMLDPRDDSLVAGIFSFVAGSEVACGSVAGKRSGGKCATRANIRKFVTDSHDNNL